MARHFQRVLQSRVLPAARGRVAQRTLRVGGSRADAEVQGTAFTALVLSTETGISVFSSPFSKFLSTEVFEHFTTAYTGKTGVNTLRVLCGVKTEPRFERRE